MFYAPQKSPVSAVTRLFYFLGVIREVMSYWNHKFPTHKSTVANRANTHTPV